MNPDAVLDDLLDEWEELEERGQPATPEVLCRSYPELLDELRRRIGRLRAVGPLLELDDGPDEAPPAVPGHQVLGLLGEGGMGVVYKARDLELHRLVAIKMPREAALPSPAARTRFVREARVLAGLRHPNIVSIHRADLDRGRPYFVMDFVAGGSLGRQMKRFAGDPTACARLIEKVAQAVEHAHQKGVLHRDLKPSNILLDEDGEPRVSDFGVAWILGGEPAAGSDAPAEPASGLTATGAAIGTPAYMAPEQFARSAVPVGPTADVWALGVVLYEMLTGRRPFGPGGPQAGPPPRPRALCRVVDPQLEVIVLQCLEKVPGDRFPSAGALADALRGWVGGQGWRRGVRRGVAPALGIGAAVLALAPWAGQTAPRPSMPAGQERIVRQLTHGEPVELIPAVGPPAAYRLRTGAAAAVVSLAKDGTFNVFSPEITLVELLADSQAERYRVTVEVRQDGCPTQGGIGLYFAHQTVELPRGKGDLFGVFHFADLGPSARRSEGPDGRNGSRAILNHVFYRIHDQPFGRWGSYAGGSVWYEPPKMGVRPGPWRVLSVEVRPESVKARMDNMTLLPFGRKHATDWCEGLPNDWPELKMPKIIATRRGGLGLYVFGCQGSFRRCRIEPF